MLRDGYIMRLLLLPAIWVAGCDMSMNMNQSREQRNNLRDVPQTRVRTERFVIGIEQQLPGQKDWHKIMPDANRVVKVARRPFRLVVFFEEKSPMIVHASFRPDIYSKAVRGRELNSVFRNDASIAEPMNNPNQLVYVHNEPYYHNWLCFSSRTHRFDYDGVVDVPQGMMCRRTIKKLVIDSNEIPLEQCNAKQLYLVFLKTTRSSGSMKRIEKQRDWLEIQFID